MKKYKLHKKSPRTNWKKLELGFVSLELQAVDWMPAKFLPVAGVEDGCYGRREVVR